MDKYRKRRTILTLGVAVVILAGIAVAAFTTRVTPALATPGLTNQCDAAGCHAYPPINLSISATTTSTTVTGGSSFPVNITWAGGNGVNFRTEVNWPATFTNVTRDNNLFNPNPRIPYSGLNASGTTTSTLTAPATPGTYTVRVYVSTSSPRETAYQDLTITVVSSGPVTSALIVTPNPTNGASSAILTATVSAVNTGNYNIAAAEYFIDSPGINGAGTAMTGSFNSATVPVTATLNLSGLSMGSHVIYVHGKDTQGTWGSLASTALSVSIMPKDNKGPVTGIITVAPNPTNGTALVTLSASNSDTNTGGSNVTKAEYFIDIVGPNGYGTPMAGTFNGQTVTATASVSTSGLAAGSHVVYVRGKDSIGNWGPSASGTFSVNGGTTTVDKRGPLTTGASATVNSNNTALTLSASASDTATGGSNVVAGEYFIDAAEPNGSGTPMTGIFSTATVALSANVNISVLPAGNHVIYLHGKDAAGNWGPVNSVIFNIVAGPAAIYSTNCASCHGASGQGASGPAIAGTSVTTTTILVRDGGPTMPAYTATQINSTDLSNLATLVRALGPVPTTGAAIYDLNCSSCHGSTGQGTRIAPEVGGIPPATLTPSVRNGLLPIMPAYSTTDINSTGMTNLANYIATLPGPPVSGWGVYAEYCARCHGVYGTRDNIVGDSVSSVTSAVRNGEGGDMPAYNTTQISNTALNNLANYVNGGLIPPNGSPTPPPPATGTAPTAPTNLSATAISSSRVNLSWTNNASNAASISIQRATSSTFGTGLNTVSVGSSVTSYSDTTVTGSTTYYYRVYASNTAGNSGYSNTASATTLASSSSSGSGPVTSNVAASPNPTNGASSITLTATISDSGTGGSDIREAEYFIDTIGSNGNGRSMSASDGSFNEVTEGVRASVSTYGLSRGNHTIYVHGRDANGNWGAFATVLIEINDD